MANRRPAPASTEETTAEAPVEAPAVEAPAPAPAAPKASKGQGGFVGDPDEIHRKYFIPPAGYTKPKFPSSI